MSSYYYNPPAMHTNASFSVPGAQQQHSARPRRGARFNPAYAAPKSLKPARPVRESVEATQLAVLRRDFDAARSFDIDDDEIFCPWHLLTEDDVCSEILCICLTATDHIRYSSNLSSPLPRITLRHLRLPRIHRPCKHRLSRRRPLLFPPPPTPICLHPHSIPVEPSSRYISHLHNARATQSLSLIRTADTRAPRRQSRLLDKLRKDHMVVAGGDTTPMSSLVMVSVLNKVFPVSKTGSLNRLTDNAPPWVQSLPINLRKRICIV